MISLQEGGNSLGGENSNLEGMDSKYYIGTNNKDTVANFMAFGTGGNGFSAFSFSEFGKAYNKWIDDYNKMDEHNTMIEICAGGLCPVWELLPDRYDVIAQRMEIIFNESIENENNGFLSKFNSEVDKTKEFSGGNGTINNPYIIENEAQLKLINEYMCDDNIHFELANNIIIKENWKPLGTYKWETGTEPNKYFSGILDGKGYTISFEIAVQKVNDLNYFYSYGLFGAIKNAKIKNLNMVVSIKTIDNAPNSDWDMNNDCSPTYPIAGAITGWASGSEILNCFAESYISLLYEGNQNTGCTRVGGIVGYAKSCEFYDCNARGNLKSSGFNSATGGLVGTIYSTSFFNCGEDTFVTLYCEKWAWLFGTKNKGEIFGSEDKRPI